MLSICNETISFLKIKKKIVSKTKIGFGNGTHGRSSYYENYLLSVTLSLSFNYINTADLA